MILLREGSANQADALFMELTTNPLPAPQLMLFPSGGGVPDWFFRDGMAERALINWVIDNFITADTAFLDIGAHVGTYTWTCGRKALRTYAFECSPVAFCHLAANVALHGLAERVTLCQLALGEYEGETDLYVRSIDGGGNGVKRLTGSEGPSRRVRMSRLDTLDIQTPIGFIKLDVEGAEREVLLGAAKTLQRNNRPPILFESWGAWKESEGVQARQLRDELFGTLTDLGYAVVEVAGCPDTFLAMAACQHGHRGEPGFHI